MRANSLHEMEWNEINHALDATWQCIEDLYAHPNMKPQKTRDALEFQINSNLKTLADSVTRSLVYLYPKKEYALSEVIDANEAWWFIQFLKESNIGLTPLHEGVEALLQIFLILETYRSDYRPEEIERIRSDFVIMERAIKEYVPIATKACLEKQAKERSSKGGSAPKHLPGISAAVKTMILDKTITSHSAEFLWRIFEKRHEGRKNALRLKGYKVYFEYKISNNDDERLFQLSSDGSVKSIGRSAFNGYVKEAKKTSK
jgi:hypothetical protein